MPNENEKPEQGMELHREQPLMTLQAPPLDIGGLLKQVVEKGITGENVEAMKSLVGLYEHMQDRDAKKSFVVDFNRLMAEMPAIQATKAVPNDDGTTRYTYAPFEEIDSQLRPLAMKYGFSYSFKEGDSKPGTITKVCVVRHTGGHQEENSYSCRIGSGPPKTSDSQKDGSAHQYAKRGALCDAFNIVVRGQDNDARNEGGTVTPAQADELERRVAEVNANKEAFLRFARADKFAEIKAVYYPLLDDFLAKKEGRR